MFRNTSEFKQYVRPLFEKKVRITGDDFVEVGVLKALVVSEDPWVRNKYRATLEIDGADKVVKFSSLTELRLFEEQPKTETTEKLSTIQKRENLNNIYRMGEPGPGGAYHNYDIYESCYSPETQEVPMACIEFQKGPRNDPESRHGVLDSDLLEIVRDRLQAFQSGPYACRENALALTHIEEALMWMNRRVEDRIERQVIGTMEK